jgi:hypothetical protein
VIPQIAPEQQPGNSEDFATPSTQRTVAIVVAVRVRQARQGPDAAGQPGRAGGLAGFTLFGCGGCDVEGVRQRRDRAAADHHRKTQDGNRSNAAETIHGFPS